MTDKRDNHGKNVALEGLRGIAAMVVVLAHCTYTFYPFLHSGLPADGLSVWQVHLYNSPYRFFYSGEFAVCIFFVMSGYVLSRRFFRTMSREDLIEAASKRYLRLGLPVSAAVMICFVMMRAHLYPPTPTPLLAKYGAYQGLPSSLLAIREALFGSVLFGSANYDYVLWSISVEFWASLGLFAFLAAFGRHRIAPLVAIVAAVIVLKIAPHLGIFYVLFLAGAYLHLWAHHIKGALVAVFIFAALYFGGYTPGATGYALCAHATIWLESVGISLNWLYFFQAIAAVLLVAAVANRNMASRFLSLAPFAWLGDKSFSLYLIHSFVISSLGIYAFAHSPFSSMGARVAFAVALVFAVGLIFALIFARLVDANAVKIANWFGQRTMAIVRDRFSAYGGAKG